MIKKFTLLLASAALWIATDATAQVRYKDNVFSSVTVTPDVVYGQNFEVLTGAPVLIDLRCDIYEPAGDNATDRPLIIYLHTGSFLPPIINGSPSGSRKDSATAEMCRQFARKGYVVASVSYRLGWNPQGSQEVRTGTILNAVYRSNQDAKTAIRYFRKEFAVNANPHGIDTSKVIIVGQGTGGYAGLAAAYLDKVSELNLIKFINPSTNASYVNQAQVGDFDGFGGAQGVLNNDNHVGYSSDFKLVVNLGGAIGDTSWMEAGDIPLMSFHSVSDPFAPIDNGVVLVPGTTFQVLDVSGSRAFTATANRLGLQGPLGNPTLTDLISTKANGINGGITGFYPFHIAPAGSPQAGPWEWWDSTIVKQITVGTSTGLAAHNNGMLTNPNMSKTKALLYIDTMQKFLAPRIMNVLQLPGNTLNTTSLSNGNKLEVYPNPAQTEMYLKLTGETPRSIRLVDITGRTLRTIAPTSENTLTINRGNLANGVYFLKLDYNSGTLVQRVIFN